jgi:hypothetical protein
MTASSIFCINFVETLKNFENNKRNQNGYIGHWIDIIIYLGL